MPRCLGSLLVTRGPKDLGAQSGGSTVVSQAVRTQTWGFHGVQGGAMGIVDREKAAGTGQLSLGIISPNTFWARGPQQVLLAPMTFESMGNWGGVGVRDYLQSVQLG